MSILHVGTGLPGDFATIQAAVNAAVNGDTIDIAAGTYREQATISGKVLTIHGAGDGHSTMRYLSLTSRKAGFA